MNPSALDIGKSSGLGRTAWLAVALLWPVALLNYLDRQMLAAMKFSVMQDIPSIGLEANWGYMADDPSLGWRWAFDLAGLAGIAYALPLLLWLRDPPPLEPGNERSAPPSMASAARLLLANGSFVLLVLYFTLPALAGWVVKD